jgi:hypothetical protein
MIWVVWVVLGLEGVAIAISLWITWLMISDASRAPADPFSPVKHPPERSLAQPPEAGDGPAIFTLEDVDERGYVSSRKLHLGCEAAVCRTPFGARIVAGRRSLIEPQYAWDYASVRLAEKALVYAEFSTHPRDGVIGVDDIEGDSHPAAEPPDYFRRWRYTTEGRMERF